MTKHFVLVEGLEPRDERSVSESSTCTAFGIEAWLIAIRAMRQIAVWTNKATTRRNAAVVCHRPECRKKLSPRLCNFPGFNGGFGEGECELGKSVVGHVGFNLEGVMPKVCEFFVRKFFNCRCIVTKIARGKAG